MDSTLLIVFAAVIVVGVLLLMVMAMGNRGPKVLDQQAFREQWLHIEQSLKDEEAVLQVAIINADKLLDMALKQRGYKGETMGERMKSAGQSLGDVNMVWNAHKLRNRIAHENNVRITLQLTRKVLATYKQSLRTLGAL